MNRQTAQQKKAEREVSLFNARYPIGTLVRYWKGAREGEGGVGPTRSDAYVLSGHTAVVFIGGCSGAVALSHVEPQEAQR